MCYFLVNYIYIYRIYILYMIITNVSIIGWICNIDHTDVLIIGYIYLMHIYIYIIGWLYLLYDITTIIEYRYDVVNPK